MKKATGCWLLALAVLVLPETLFAQSGSAATSVTLFNSGRVLVRRVLPINVSAGATTQTLALGEFNPATFAVLDPGVQLVSVKSDMQLNESTLLRRYVGRAFELDTGRVVAPTRRATLLSMDPERWEWSDRAGVVFGRPGRVVWPKDLVPAMMTADVTLQSDRARQSVRVMYETSGSSWATSYRLYLGAQGRIEGVASIASGVLELPDAEVQLLSGDIGRGTPPSVRGGRVDESAAYLDAVPMMANAAPMYAKAAAPMQESAGEGHLYTLPSRVSFIPGSSVVVPLFDPTPARAERRYAVTGALGYYGGIGQQPDEQQLPVGVAYRLDRKLATAFGDRPLPGGYVGIFDQDKGGRMQLVGQGYIQHTAAGAEMLVESGSAFDVTAKRVQTDYSTSRNLGPAGTPIGTVALASYRVTVQNAKDSAVVVEVREDRGGEWSVVQSSTPAEKRSATRIVFSVTVPAKGTVVLTYRVRVVW